MPGDTKAIHNGSDEYYKPSQDPLVTKQDDKARQSFALLFLCEALLPYLICTVA
jgi:hypothetical protein